MNSCSNKRQTSFDDAFAAITIENVSWHDGPNSCCLDWPIIRMSFMIYTILVVLVVEPSDVVAVAVDSICCNTTTPSLFS
jgi:hypothetical protein